MNLDVFDMLPSAESVGRRYAFLHWVLQGEFPSFNGTINRSTSCCPSRRTSFPSLGDTSVSLVVFAPWRTSEPPRPGVDNPVSPAGILPRKQQDLPSSWGTSFIRLPCSKPTPAGLLAPDHKSQQRGPWSSKGRGSRNWVFRRSVHGFRLAVYASPGRLPDTTQDSLPVAGQALLDGIHTRKVPLKGFKVVNYILSPFPKLCLSHNRQPTASLRTLELQSVCRTAAHKHYQPRRRTALRMAAYGLAQGVSRSSPVFSSSCDFEQETAIGYCPFAAMVQPGGTHGPLPWNV